MLSNFFCDAPEVFFVCGFQFSFCSERTYEAYNEILQNRILGIYTLIFGRLLFGKKGIARVSSAC